MIMAKTQYQVSEVFQCGLVKLKCIKAEGAICEGCYLDEICEFYSQCNALIGYCDASREDKTDVIFVKVKEEE